MASKLNLILNDFVSLFFPNVCIGCDSSLPSGVSFVCPACQYELPKTNNFKLMVPHIEQKLAGSVSFKYLLAYLHFQKKGVVQKVMHQLKYNHMEEIGTMLGRWYGHDLLLNGFKDEFDMVIPVPLHPSKERKRGYNQSEAFAKGLSEVLKMEVYLGLKRVTPTETQTRKSRSERLKNVEDVFEVSNDASLEGKHILLVDDVITTGATLLTCGSKLINAGAQELSFAVIAATE